MSKAQIKETNAPEPEKVPEVTGKRETEFPVKELLENSQELFGYYPEVLVAALSNKKIDKLTISNAKSLIRSFLKKEVK